jgi:hypothetical protein
MHSSYHAIIEILAWSEIVCAGARGYFVDPFTEGHQLRLRPLSLAAETLPTDEMSTTMDIYGHVFPETHQAAAANMDALFSKEDLANKEKDEDSAGE